MSKKVIGALLALVMVLSVFSLSAFAIGQYEWETTADAEDYKQTWGLADGGNGVVQVTLTTDYEVGPISFAIEGVSLETVTLGNGYYSGNATLEYNKTTGLVFIYPNTGATLKAEKLNNAVVATFTYTGNATPAIKDDPKQNTVDGMNGTLIASRCSGEYVNGSDFYVGQSYEILAFGQAPKPEEPTDVTLTGVTTGVVDTENKYVYGIPADSNPADYFTTTGYVEVVENEKGNACATGAKLNLYDKQGGNLVESYTIIIFGDVNGDAVIDGTDALDVEKIANYVVEEMELGDIGLFAAEVNNDGSVDGTDALDIEKFAFYVVEDFTVNPYA